MIAPLNQVAVYFLHYLHSTLVQVHFENTNPLVCVKCVQQLKENISNGTTLPRKRQSSGASKISSSDTRLERPPMIDISNKLHAMADDFVLNLSSECNSLANNVSAQAHFYVGCASGSEVAKGPRQSNRTSTEVLNGLKRPCGSNVTGYHDKEGSSHLEHAKSTQQEGNNKIKDGWRSTRQTKDMKTIRASSERMSPDDDGNSVDIVFETDLPASGGQHARSTHDPVSKGKSVHSVEVLSSDNSSDVSLRPATKYPKETRGKKNSTKLRTSNFRGRTTRRDIRSPSTSPASFQSLSYSYEEDINSPRVRRSPVETTFPKLRWPEDGEEVHEVGGSGTKPENTNVHPHNDSQKKNEGNKGDEDVILQVGDDSNEEDHGDNPGGSETEGEELPVLPKIPVKRKLLSERRGSEKRTQRGRTKSASPPTKKQRTPQIDASVITKLEFGRRPPNSVSIPTILL